MSEEEKPPIWPILEHYGLDAADPGSGKAKVLCCFHDESRPSASVDVDKQRFHCFSCDVSGDGYAIVMQQEGMSFVGAKQWIEESFGFAGSTVSSGTEVPERRTSLRISSRRARPKRGDDRVLRTRARRKLR